MQILTPALGKNGARDLGMVPDDFTYLNMTGLDSSFHSEKNTSPDNNAESKPVDADQAACNPVIVVKCKDGSESCVNLGRELERQKEASMLVYGLLQRLTQEEQSKKDRLIAAALLVIEKTLSDDERCAGISAAKGV